MPTKAIDYLESILETIKDISLFLQDNPEYEDISTTFLDELRDIDNELEDFRDEHC